MEDNNKKILKNTFFLYFRMIFVMVITLYTSRVVLDKLGVIDFGIYNVVGGIAMMLTFINNSLSSATQRYLNIELSNKKIDNARNVFSQHFNLYIILILIILILAETIGLWFISTKLSIPLERLNAAIWVYQFTILSLCFSILGIIYNSAIIAHEDMSVYSYGGILDGILRLLIAYLISILPFDHLITFGFLSCLSVFFLQLFYALYCIKHYSECTLKFSWDPVIIKDSVKFISWNFVDMGIYSINSQGINFLLNIFFGPVVNAARAISYQVNTALSNLTTNFSASIRPQMYASYGSGNYEQLIKLLFMGSKYSFFLYWMLMITLLSNIDNILNIWLTNVPKYTSEFIFWILLYSLINVLINSLRTVILATGEISSYIKLSGTISLFQIPISLLFLELDYSAVFVFVINVFFRFIYYIITLIISLRYNIFNFKDYLFEVIRPAVIVMSISGLFTLYISSNYYTSDILNVIFKSLLVLIITGFTILFFGMNFREKSFLLKTIRLKQHVEK